MNEIIRLSTWTEAYNDSIYQNGYTLFYFTWWFAWAPFVSLFIARISYGRTIKEFIVGVLFVPSLLAPSPSRVVKTRNLPLLLVFADWTGDQRKTISRWGLLTRSLQSSWFG